MRDETVDPDLRHLEAEFNRIDVLLQREIRRWLLADQDFDDDYRGLYVADTEAHALLTRPFAMSWGQSVEIPVEEAVAFGHALSDAAARVEAITSRYSSGGVPLRLTRLAQEFQLDRIDLDILLLCLAPAFETKYERLYGYLQDNVTHRRPSVRLVLDLLGNPGIAKFGLANRLFDHAPLFRECLVERITEPPPAGKQWLNQTLEPDETVVAWLLGTYHPHRVLGSHARLTEGAPSVTELMLAGNCLQRLSLDDHQGETPLIALHGPDQTEQDAAARVIAQHFGCSLLTVDVKAAAKGENSAAAVVRMSLRDGKLTGAVVYLRHWDDCLDEDRYAPPEICAALCTHASPIILSSAATWRMGGLERSRTVRTCESGVPDYHRRKLFWGHYLAEMHTEGFAAAVDDLAARFVLTSDKIRDAAAAAKDAAAGTQPTVEQLFVAARTYSNPRLSSLAHKVAGRFAWSDLVLPENQVEILRELTATVVQRFRVLEEWGVGQKLVSSSGITALFAGPPGTGKTMAAETLASELGLDLYKIDLASVMSKYIGETEKNLERIFNEAARSNSILFFDEADAIFGKRSEVKDAHDRYANLEISYLLQRMESYDGVTILATNLRANLDDAFTRRLQFIVDFPFPQSQERRRIWTTLFPADLPQAPDLDFDMLARRFELSGGNIRNVIVSAAYLAANNGNLVTMEHLLHGVRRELQKMGRTISAIDMT